MTDQIPSPQPAPAHSAGVWEVLDNRNNRFEPGSVHVINYGRTIATVAYQLPDAQGETERMANARLIAAAPYLLRALQELLECPYDIDEATISKAGLEETMKRSPYQVVGHMSVALARVRSARAAIIKATGAQA